MQQINERTQLLNNQSANNDGQYVLYWMQMFKRTEYNYALNFAIEQANLRKIPLVVYEGLKYYYPWANDRIHTFILEGVEEKRKAFPLPDQHTSPWRSYGGKYFFQRTGGACGGT